MFWQKRQPKEEHPSTHPDCGADSDVEESRKETRAIGFHNDGSICYPPQGGSVLSDPYGFPVKYRSPVANPTIITKIYR